MCNIIVPFLRALYTSLKYLLINKQFQIVFRFSSSVECLMTGAYLRYPLTHTVNNLLQKLNYVIFLNILLLNKTINIIHIMCENFGTIPWVLCKIQLI